MITKNTRGLTLIELLVVIALIGLLAVIILVALTNTRAKARNAQRITNLQSISRAVEIYFNDRDRYPIEHWYDTSMGCTTDPTPPSGDNWSDGTCPAGETLDVQLANYITLPRDPINNSTYRYAYEGAWPAAGPCCKAYMLVVRFETSNPQPNFRICGGDYAGAWFESACQQENPSP